MPEMRTMDEREKEFLKLITSRGTIGILRYLKKHDIGQYHHFNEFIITATLNERLRQLLRFNLIKHYFVKKGVIKRKEWYEITEKGREVLQILEDILKLIEKIPP